MAGMRRVLKLPDARELSFAAAGEFTRAVGAVKKGKIHIALSGGNTPKAFHKVIVDKLASRIPWDRVHVYWGDERCVPPDHPDSNYKMAMDTLLSHVPVPSENIHRIMAEQEGAAAQYESLLRREMGDSPRFDWIFLGLGPDGHTASLFPGTPAVQEGGLVCDGYMAAKQSRRITFTLPLINAAAKVAFVVSGPEKADMVRTVLEDPPSPSHPASLVSPAQGELLWLLDRDAASRLKA
ncbi:MAG: 6-phosphogluconolactonase [Elusimicrobia bacterium]|nr:6-phosphogluconolactonase [Elusimicrobiota bacterium]MDE2511493.1 6-phosphogluconolactonase [Elusimicrobiota bacterium]